MIANNPVNESILPQRVELGRTGIQISPLGIGTWQWGDRMFWGYGQGEYSDADLQAAFDDSLRSGINFFDTAEVYGCGRSESLLGRAVRAAGSQWWWRPSSCPSRPA